MIDTPDRPSDDPRPQLDLARSADLGDHVAVVAVHRDGYETLWLMQSDFDDDAGFGCSCRGCAPHDQIGAYRVTPTHAVPGDGR